VKSKPNGVTNRVWDEYSTLTRKRKLEKSHLAPELLLMDVNKTRNDLIALDHDDLASLATFALIRLDTTQPVLESYYKIMMIVLGKSLPTAIKGFKAAIDGWLLEKSSGPGRFAHERALKAAIAKLEKDPKQAAKADAVKLWKERRDGNHPKLRTNEQFAAECMRRWPVLTSAKVILGWCAQWNKEAKRESQHAS